MQAFDLLDKTEAETFAKPQIWVQFEVRAAQKAQTYHLDRQAFEQRITKKCAKDGDFTKVSGRLKRITLSDGLDS